MQGYIQVYTGNGKGKTTAAVGLAIRAAGAGLNVFIGQFIKTGEYSEVKALKRFSERITIEQFGLGYFLNKQPAQMDIDAAVKGLFRVREIFAAGHADLVILEEANVAVKRGLFSVQDLLDLIDARPENVELLITGRSAAQEIIERADLVTEMKAVKHYIDKGVRARIGIEK